ncbi:hypothetical protein ACVIIW_005168 [Bradyrhizobium sp. USDA 4449]
MRKRETRMGNRTAKFISALIGSIVAGVPLAAVSQNAPSAPPAASTANAAGDCLASPKGVAPHGQHWHYRLERATKRQCWYLRAEDAKAAQIAQAAADTPDAAPPAAQSVQNAHAEYMAQQQTRAAAVTPAPAAASARQAPSTLDANAAQPAITAPGPDATATAASPQPAAAPAPNAAQPSENPAASPAPAALAAAEPPADKPTGSLQMLLLVVGGALALAGILASVIYRFAGGRRRVRTADRRVKWDHRQDDHDSRAPWHTEPAPHVARPLPVDFDSIRSEGRQIAAFSDAIGRIAAQGRPTQVAATEPDETEIDYFHGEFEIERPAPHLADDIRHDEPAEPDADAHQEHAVDENGVAIDIITAMLERLATEGPRLTRPAPKADLASLEADPAALARSSQGQSAARA